MVLILRSFEKLLNSNSQNPYDEDIPQKGDKFIKKELNS